MSVHPLRDPLRPADARYAAPIGRYAFGPFLLDCPARLLCRGTHAVSLTPKAFDVLCVLVTRASSAVSKDEILRAVWPDTFVGDDNLTQHIAILRKVLGDSSDHPHFIATVPKYGYRFAAPVSPVEYAERPAQSRGLSKDADRHTVGGPAADVEAGGRRLMMSRLLGGRAGILAGRAKDVLLGAVTVLLLAVSWTYYQHLEADEPNAPVQFTIAAPAGARLVSVGVPSPNGRQIVLVAADASGTTALWVRSLESIEVRRIEGTERAVQPFWFPDGRSLGFFADSALKIVPVSGGLPHVLASLSAAGPLGGARNARGDTLFGQSRSGLSLIAGSGGASRPMTVLDASAFEIEHMWPSFLPDGIHFLFGVRSANPERNGVYLGAVGSTLKRRVVPATFAATFAFDRLFFVRDGTLLAQPFDLTQVDTTGAAVAVATGIARPRSWSSGAAVGGGVVTYMEDGGPSHLTWFDREGRSLGVLDSPIELTDVNVSPDESQLVATDALSTSAGLWLFDLRRQVGSRFSTIGGAAAWSRDSRQLVFSSAKMTGVLSMYQRAVLGNEPEQPLLEDGRTSVVNDWSRDGRFIVFAGLDASTKFDLWLLPASGDPRPRVLVQTPFNEFQAQVAPNGRWVAYTSDETGSWEIYVREFPTGAAKRRISTHQGLQPRWRADGRELFYIAQDQRMMAVPMIDGPNGLDTGVPTPLFTVRTRTLSAQQRVYAVVDGGRRFLIDTDNELTNQSTTVLLNWVPRQ